jgi:hypothetical protein
MELILIIVVLVLLFGGGGGFFLVVDEVIGDRASCFVRVASFSGMQRPGRLSTRTTA